MRVLRQVNQRKVNAAGLIAGNEQAKAIIDGSSYSRL